MPLTCTLASEYHQLEEWSSVRGLYHFRCLVLITPVIISISILEKKVRLLPYQLQYDMVFLTFLILFVSGHTIFLNMLSGSGQYVGYCLKHCRH